MNIEQVFIMKRKIFIPFLFALLAFLMPTKLQAQCNGFTFTANVIGNTVSFTPNVPNGLIPISYFWTFGDGGTDTSPLAIYTYANNGTYNVCLTISGFDQNFNQFTCIFCDSVQVGNVAQNPCNQVTFTKAVNGNTVNFTPNYPAGFTPSTYNWTFGDGGTSTLPTPNHVYANNGTYNVCLTISGFDNNLNQFTCNYCDSLTIGNPNQNICSQLSFNKVTNGNTVDFTTNLPAGFTPNSYNWTFGDGGTSTLQNPSHTYANNGAYNVCVTVSGYDSMQNFLTCVFCDSIAINGGNQNPCNGITITANKNGANVSFSLNTPPGYVVNTYNWAFGDGGTSTQPTPSHTYTSNGVYTYCVSISGQIQNNTPFQCTVCDSVSIASVNTGLIDFSKANILSIYPNPAMNYIEISIPPNSENKISIYDISGKKVIDFKLISNIERQQVSIEQLSKGMYHVELMDKDGKHYRGNFMKN